MTNLTTHTTEDGLEFYINNKTGESFASQAGLGRMCKVAQTTISRYLSGGASIAPEKAEILTAAGLRSVALYDESAIVNCIAKYNPQLLILLRRAGLRVYLHGLVGFKVTSTAVVEDESSDTYIEALKALLIKVKADESDKAKAKALRLAADALERASL